MREHIPGCYQEMSGNGAVNETNTTLVFPEPEAEHHPPKDILGKSKICLYTHFIILYQHFAKQLRYLYAYLTWLSLTISHFTYQCLESQFQNLKIISLDLTFLWARQNLNFSIVNATNHLRSFPHVVVRYMVYSRIYLQYFQIPDFVFSDRDI